MAKQLTRIHTKLKKKAREIGVPEIIFGFATGVILLYLSLVIHELGHVFFAWFFGYHAGIGGLIMYEGWTSVMEENIPIIVQGVIAMAGPLTSFLAGAYFWEQGRGTLERYLATILWLISTAPNVLPVPDGRDATFIIKAFGYPFTWVIFLMTFGYMWAKILFEGVGPLEEVR